MTARTIPTLPTWAAGQRVLASNLASMVGYQAFWASPPMFRMYQLVAQSLANGTFAQVTMDTSGWDTDNGRAVGTPYSYTIPVGMPGRWRFNWKINFFSSATGARAAQLYKNGTAITDEEFINAAANGAGTSVLGTASVVVSAGDVMSVWGFQSSGGPLNTDTFSPSFFEGELRSLATP